MYRYRMDALTGIVPAGSLVTIHGDYIERLKNRLQQTADEDVLLAFKPLTIRQGEEFSCNLDLTRQINGLAMVTVDKEPEKKGRARPYKHD